MEELRNKVAQAVHVLNHDSQSTNRAAANEWLVQFQQTDWVWQVATSILSSPSSGCADFELHFFAAQILKNKIHEEGRLLSLGVRDTVYNSLLSSAKRFSSGPPQLLTQVCLALAALMLQTVEHGKPIEQLFGNLRSLECELGGDIAVLEMLTILPEEVSDTPKHDTRTSLEQRCLYGRELLSQTPAVLEFLAEESLKSCDGGLQFERSKKVLRCLLSWVRAGCLSEIPNTSLGTHPLLNFIFKSLMNSSLFSLAIEVLIEIVSHHEEFTRIIFGRVSHLSERILFPALCEGNDSVVHGVACLLVEIGQAVPYVVVEAGVEARLLFEALLRCTSFPTAEWGIADITLQFWSGLAHCIFSLQTMDKLNRDHVEEIFYPLFSALLDAIIQRAQVDESSYSDTSEILDLPDSLVQFRTNLDEILLDICQLLKPAAFLKQLSLSNWKSTIASSYWKDVEVKLFALNVVAELVLQEVQTLDLPIIMQLVAILSGVTYEELKGFVGMVYISLVEVIGSYSKWISATQSDPRPLLMFLTVGIAKPQFSRCCVSTLRKLCEDFSARLCEPQHLELILWIGEAVEKYHIPNETEEDLVGAISMILGSVKNIELMKELLIRFLSSSFDAVQKLTDADNYYAIKENQASYSQMVNSAVSGLCRIGTTFGHVTNQTHVAAGDMKRELLKMFLPLLEKLLRSDHVKSRAISLAACRALSVAIQSSGQQLLPLLPNILDLLTTNFLSNQRHDCYIRTAAVVMEEFGSKEEFGPFFITTFQRITQSASVLALHSPHDCDQEPDLVESYTNFAFTFVGSSAKETFVAAGPILEVSFQKAAISCAAMHRGAAFAAMSYLSCFLDTTITSLLESGSSTAASYSATAVQVIAGGGQTLVASLVYALLGVSAMSRVHKCGTLLQQLATVCFLCETCCRNGMLSWKSLHTWLEASVKGLPDSFLRQGESEALIPLWLDALCRCASECMTSKIGDGAPGKGGKALKRLLREFVDNHRNQTLLLTRKHP